MTNPKDQSTMATAISAPASDDRIEIELDLDRDPREPQWLRDARSAINGCTTLAELEQAVIPMRSWDESRKAQIRPVKVARENALRAALRVELAVTSAGAVPVRIVPAPSNPAAPVAVALVAQGMDSDDATATAVALVQASTEEKPPAAGQFIEMDLPMPATLTAIAAESQANAAGLNLAQGGVAASDVNPVAGFNNAQAYATAARNAVTEVTRRHYITMARQGGVEIDESTLPPLPDQSGPISQNPTRHVPTGPSIFDRPRSQRAFRPGVNATVATIVEAAPLMKTGDLIMGSVAAGQGASVSWSRSRHAVSCPSTKLREALATIGREGDAPKLKSTKAQFGDVMQGLNNNGLMARAAVKAVAARQGLAWPQTVASRWIVGSMDATADLGSLGEKHLVADLHDNGTVTFTGDETLGARVRSAFDARVASNVYDSTDLIQWLEKMLRRVHHGITWGGMIYVPSGEVEAVKQLIGAVKTLMGRAFAVACVTTEEGLIEGLVEGLAEEAADVGKKFTDAQDMARERARKAALLAEKSEAEADLAARRAVVLSGAAATILREIATVSERVRGYEALLGAERVAGVKATLTALDAQVRPLVDDTSARFAALDLD
jgi:hypothetical protein